MLLYLLLSLGMVALASIIIMYACNSFEDAADYLGRNMPPGVKGATINAIGSSLPELLTTLILLVFFLDADGFSGGVATCAGSAVFNAAVIPGLCIVTVVFIGVKNAKGIKEKVPFITVGTGTILRDGFFLILAELVLIYLLSNPVMSWWMGLVLMGVYVLYFAFLMYQFKTHGTEDGDSDDDDDDDEDDDEEVGKLKALVTFDFNQLFFSGADFTNARAWVVLGSATAVIAVACYILSEAVVLAASDKCLDIPLYFTTVILAAAATSVPDTVLSMKDAMAGDYDDAVSNALGSNIFDITVALGFPLFIFGLIHGADITLASEASGGAVADVQILRVVLLGFTAIVLLTFLIGRKMTGAKGVFLLSIYGFWTAFIVMRAMDVAWVNGLVNSVNGVFTSIM
jgi:cation:H+ antiporter